MVVIDRSRRAVQAVVDGTRRRAQGAWRLCFLEEPLCRERVSRRGRMGISMGIRMGISMAVWCSGAAVRSREVCLAAGRCVCVGVRLPIHDTKCCEGTSEWGKRRERVELLAGGYLPSWLGG
jgi:hypothetical protein